MYACMYVRTYVCMYVCMYIYIYVCRHIRYRCRCRYRSGGLGHGSFISSGATPPHSSQELGRYQQGFFRSDCRCFFFSSGPNRPHTKQQKHTHIYIYIYIYIRIYI